MKTINKELTLGFILLFLIGVLAGLVSAQTPVWYADPFNDLETLQIMVAPETMPPTSEQNQKDAEKMKSLMGSIVRGEEVEKEDVRWAKTRIKTISKQVETLEKIFERQPVGNPKKRMENHLENFQRNIERIAKADSLNDISALNQARKFVEAEATMSTSFLIIRMQITQLRSKLILIQARLKSAKIRTDSSSQEEDPGIPEIGPDFP